MRKTFLAERNCADFCAFHSDFACLTNVYADDRGQPQRCQQQSSKKFCFFTVANKLGMMGHKTQRLERRVKYFAPDVCRCLAATWGCKNWDSPVHTCVRGVYSMYFLFF